MCLCVAVCARRLMYQTPDGLPLVCKALNIGGGEIPTRKKSKSPQKTRRLTQKRINFTNPLKKIFFLEKKCGKICAEKIKNI